jgi:hypothetical protein
MLTKTRWLLLKRRENMSADERGRPSEQTAAALEGAMRTAGVAVSSLARCYVKEETCPFPDTRPLRPCAARCGSRVGREAGIVPACAARREGLRGRSSARARRWSPRSSTPSLPRSRSADDPGSQRSTATVGATSEGRQRIRHPPKANYLHRTLGIFSGPPMHAKGRPWFANRAAMRRARGSRASPDDRLAGLTSIVRPQRSA